MLTDVMMPNMNGLELAERFREVHPETRVIFMSGYADQVIAEGEGAIPEADFIGKPLVPTRLTAKIREVLDRT